MDGHQPLQPHIQPAQVAAAAQVHALQQPAAQIINVKLPPTFSGESTDKPYVTVKEFIKKFQTYALNAGRQNDLVWIFHNISSYLTGTAFLWFSHKNLQDYADPEAIYNSIISLFDKPQAKLSLLSQLVHMKYDISHNPDTFCDQIFTLCLQLNILDDASQISYLLLALPIEIQSHMSTLALDTFGQARASLKNLEPLLSSILQSTVQKSASESHINDKIDMLVEQVKALSSVQPSVSAMQSPQSMQQHVVCQLCFSHTHTADCCPSLQQFESKPHFDKKSMFCTYCHKYGHVIKSCWKKQKSEQKNALTAKSVHLN